MKPLSCILTMLLSFCIARAQEPGAFHQSEIVPSMKLEIAFHKTTFLVFAAPIQSADRGGSYVLAEKVKGCENVLKVKAGEKDFEPSNLHVVTDDGKIFPFDVRYNEQPQALTIDLRNVPHIRPVSFQGASLNTAQLEHYADFVKTQPFLNIGRYCRHKMRFSLNGVYCKENFLFFLYRLKNHSQLGYESNSLRFFIRDKKKARRTAVQDTESHPLFVKRYNKPEDKNGQWIVVVFPKFTIADSKYFIAEITEKNGDRNPVSKLDQRHLLKAMVLQ